MNAFYIQLYLNPLGLFNRIAVGLFLSVNHHVQFAYSERKWSVTSKLLPESTRSNVERYLKDLKKQVDSSAADRSQSEAFEIPKFSSDYFDYLSGYPNNLITYSDPKAGFGDFSRDYFDDLFCMLVDPKHGTKKGEESEEKFDKIIYKRLEQSAWSEPP